MCGILLMAIYKLFNNNKKKCDIIFGKKLLSKCGMEYKKNNDKL